jgi:hypothetical protein
MKVVLLAAMLCACGSTSQLVDVTAEPPGEHCASGGSAVAVGYDDNDDGVLEESEIDSIEYVCDGGAGSDGDPMDLQIETRAEPAGANCADGGTAIVIGVDADANGTLEPSEVQRTVYVCNAADGSTTLVDTRPELPGANCSLGGTTILVGLDDNDNGTLEPAEVTSTSFVCDGMTSTPGVLHGSYTIRSDLDVALIAGVTEIEQVLTIEAGSVPATITLPDLERAGSIQMFDSFSSEGRALRFPRLKTVFQLALQNVSELELPALETIGSTLQLRMIDGAPVVLPELRSIGSHVLINDNGSSMERIEAPRLETIGGGLFLTTPTIATLDLRSLVSIHQFHLLDCPNLTLAGVRIPAITTLPGGLSLIGVPWPTLGPFANLESTTTLRLRELPLTEIRLDELTTVGTIDIKEVPDLAQMSMAAITNIGGSVTVIAPQLPECQVTNILTQAGYTGPRTIQAAPCP